MKYCEFCYKRKGRFFIESSSKWCCEGIPSECPSRKALKFTYDETNIYRKKPICDYCYEKPGLYYKKEITSWCCEKQVFNCRQKRKYNDYKLIKMLFGHSLMCDYGCNKAAKYILRATGSVSCCKDPRHCPELKKRAKNKRIAQGFRVQKLKNPHPCLCGECDKLVDENKKFYNRSHMKAYYNKVGWPSHKCVWKGKKRPDHSKKLKETPHHYRGKKGRNNHFAISENKKKKTTIRKLKRLYPIFSIEEDLRYNPDNKNKIQARCKNSKCKNSKENDGWFTAPYNQLYARASALDLKQTGGMFLYCSEECKQECTLYKVNSSSIVKEYLGKIDKQLYYTQSEYSIWRDEVLKRADYDCEYCGKAASDAHHSRPQKLEPFFSLDPDYGIACCEDCHYKKAHKDDCSTGMLSVKVC